MGCESGSSLPPRPFLFISLSFISHCRGAFSGFRNLWQTAYVVAVLIFIWLLWVLVVMQFPDQGSNLGPLRWELGVLATGPPGKSLPGFCFKTAVRLRLESYIISVLKSHRRSLLVHVGQMSTPGPIRCGKLERGGAYGLLNVTMWKAQRKDIFQKSWNSKKLRKKSACYIVLLIKLQTAVC